MSRMDEILEQINNLKTEYKIAAQEKLNEQFALIFDKYPKLEEFAWTQYTCYFADGDPVYFSVYADSESIWVNGDRYYDMDENDIKERFGSEETFNEMTEEISNLLFSISGDTLKDIYGDHVKVIVSRDGIILDDYSHHD